MTFRVPVAAVVAVLLIASIGSAQECDESVFFVTHPGTIVLHHNQTLFNCCAWIDFEIIQEGSSIEIWEHEEFLAAPCDCLCCFDVSVTIGGLTPGAYFVSIWKTSDFGGTEFVGEWIVGVGGTSPPALTAAYLPCAETSIEEGASWGAIKALYRP